MEKSFYNIARNNICRFCLFTLCLSPLSVAAELCTSCGCSVSKDEISYQGLGDYEEMLREFDRISELEEELQPRGFFLQKWCKHLKKWFKKKLVKVLIKMVDLNKFKNGEHCAFELAHFKKKIDKKLYNTGSLDNIFSEIDLHSNVCQEAKNGMNRFKERVNYYYTHDKALPPGYADPNRYDMCIDCSTNIYGYPRNELEDIPIRALFGGVEIGCGALIAVLPFPGCRFLGFSLITHGSSQIYEGYMQEYEKNKYKTLTLETG